MLRFWLCCFFFFRCCNQIAAGILISVEHFSYFRCETRAGWAGAVNERTNEQRSCGDCLQFSFSLVIIRRFCSFCAICHLVAWKVAGDNEHMNYSGQKLPGISCVSTFSAYFCLMIMTLMRMRLTALSRALLIFADGL